MAKVKDWMAKTNAEHEQDQSIFVGMALQRFARHLKKNGLFWARGDTYGKRAMGQTLTDVFKSQPSVQFQIIRGSLAFVSGFFGLLIYVNSKYFTFYVKYFVYLRLS
jgi:hypothetical protein